MSNLSQSSENQFQEPILTLGNLKDMINTHLKAIGELDRELASKQAMLEKMRKKLADQFGNEENHYVYTRQEFDEQIDTINNLEEVCQSIAEQKIELSEKMESTLTQLSHQYEEQVNQIISLSPKESTSMIENSKKRKKVGKKQQKNLPTISRRSRNLRNNGQIKDKSSQSPSKSQTISTDYQKTQAQISQKTSKVSKHIKSSYCSCGIDTGEKMIMCQNQECKLKWYHFSCIEMHPKQIPEGEWYCRACIEAIKVISFDYDGKRTTIKMRF